MLAPGPTTHPTWPIPDVRCRNRGIPTSQHDEWKPDFSDIRAKMDDDVRLWCSSTPTIRAARCAGRQSRCPAGHCTRLSQLHCCGGRDLRRARLHGTACFGRQPKFGRSVIALNGVSKVYYAPGWRIGYMALHDPTNRLPLVRDGLERLLRSRLCASTPAQLGYLAGLEGDRQWMEVYAQRVLNQRNHCLNRIEGIEGLEVERPGGAFYMFIRLTDDHWAADDKAFVLNSFTRNTCCWFTEAVFHRTRERSMSDWCTWPIPMSWMWPLTGLSDFWKSTAAPGCRRNFHEASG